MADGSTKAVEAVCAGDVVLSYRAEAKSFASSRVVETHKSTSRELVAINREYVVTASEPLFNGDRWITAGDLKAGDCLRGQGGQVVVKSVERLRQRATVYNLNVEPHHNYYACGLLVHNK